MLLEERKNRGAFYTKPSVAELVAKLVVHPEHILFDPACGAGNLLTSAVRAQKALKQNSSVPHVIGVEVDHEAAVLAQSSLGFILKDRRTFSILVGDTFEVLGKTTTEEGFLALPTVKETNERPVTILANPPFTRTQRTTPAQRVVLGKFLGQELPSFGLHFYYIVLVTQLLRCLPAYSRYAIILPLTVSTSHKGKEILEGLLSEADLLYIIASEAETAFSVDSNLEEIILVGEKRPRETSGNLETSPQVAKAVTLTAVIDSSNFEAIVSGISEPQVTSTREKLSQKQLFRSREVWITDLVRKVGGEGWSFLYTSQDKDQLLQRICTNLVPLDQELKRFRGVNLPVDFFFLPNKHWLVAAETSNEITIEPRNAGLGLGKLTITKQFLRPILRKPEFYKESPSVADQERKFFLLYIPPEVVESGAIPSEVEKYARFGETLGFHLRSNTKKAQQSRGKHTWVTLGFKSYKEGDLALCFKWDPRYRSFLTQLLSTPKAASQAFWLLNAPRGRKQQIITAAWLNSTLGMGFLFRNADVQRRVWRQLAGERIGNIPIIPFHLAEKMSPKDISILEAFLSSRFTQSFSEEIKKARVSLKSNNSNLRSQVDLIFLKQTTLESHQKLEGQLMDYYRSFSEELDRTTVVQ